MLKHVPYLALQEQHFFWLLQAEGAKPDHERRSPEELMLAAKAWMLFEIERPGGGIVAVERVGSRLVLHALTAPNFGASFRKAVAALRRLAADLECDAVETMVWDRRLARAMQNVGVRAEAVQMVLRVGG